MQWNPTTSIDEPELLAGTCADADTQWFHGVRIFLANLDPENENVRRVAAMRLFCHLCIDRIPEAGLRDVYDTLMDSYRFYQLPPAQPRPRSTSTPILGVFPTVGARRFKIEED